MKIYCHLPWGGHLYIEREPRKPREPMDRDKFFALVALAAGALVMAWLLAGTMV